MEWIMGKKRVYIYYATYIGTQKNIKITGVGKVYIGKEFKVPNKKIWFGLDIDPNFKTRKGYSYEHVED